MNGEFGIKASELVKGYVWNEGAASELIKVVGNWIKVSALYIDVVITYIEDGIIVVDTQFIVIVIARLTQRGEIVYVLFK